MARWPWFWAAVAQTMAAHAPAVAFSTSPGGRFPWLPIAVSAAGDRLREQSDGGSPR